MLATKWGTHYIICEAEAIYTYKQYTHVCIWGRENGFTV